MQENLHIRFQGGKESQWEFQEFTLIGKWGQKLSMFFNEVISKSHRIKAFWRFQNLICQAGGSKDVLW